MADTPTDEALRAQAVLAQQQQTPVFAPDLFDGGVFDSVPNRVLVDVTGTPLTVVAQRTVEDPTDPYEVARAAGGQGSIRATQGLTTDEISEYPTGSHNPKL
jgi:hypothetical protein